MRSETSPSAISCIQDRLIFVGEVPMMALLPGGGICFHIWAQRASEESRSCSSPCALCSVRHLNRGWNKMKLPVLTELSYSVHMYVCTCVRGREREYMCVCVCVCVYEWKEYVCTCVREGERERENDNIKSR